MSAIHQQAMNHVYQQVLQRLLGYLTRAERTALQLLIQRLVVAAGGIERIASFKVLVQFSGSKESAYTVALLRAAQLSIAGRSPGTFNLRVASMHHAGVTPAVMDNIDRTYCALFLHDDPRVELLMVDGDQVQRFEPDLVMSLATREKSRSDMLISGHLSAGDGRTTFCNSCNLGIVGFFGKAAGWGSNPAAVVSGESRKEQKQYVSWVMRLAPRNSPRLNDWGNQNFGNLLKIIDSVGQAYHQELYGDGSAVPERLLPLVSAASPFIVPPFISVADLIPSGGEEHWKLLTEFLGVRFDDLAFSFSQSDCANPLLMAHLRGLKVQHVQGRRYEDGIDEYLQLAKAMMRRKRMPKRLVEQAIAAYQGEDAIATRRALAAQFALDAFGLNESQLVCLLFSPFVNEGRDLEVFLRRCHPGMLVALADLHRALQGAGAPEQVLQWLVEISGLTLAALNTLYLRSRVDFADRHSLIARVRAADPDKVTVRTVDAQTGEAVMVTLSGR